MHSSHDVIEFYNYVILNPFRIFISKNISFLFIQLNSKHVKPNIGKMFKTNNILVTVYLTLDWNNVKKGFFFLNKSLNLNNNFHFLLISDGNLVFNLIPCCHRFMIKCTLDNRSGFI